MTIRAVQFLELASGQCVWSQLGFLQRPEDENCCYLHRIIFFIVIVRDVHGTSIGINVEYSYWMMLTDMSLIKMCLLDPKLWIINSVFCGIPNVHLIGLIKKWKRNLEMYWWIPSIRKHKNFEIFMFLFFLSVYFLLQLSWFIMKWDMPLRHKPMRWNAS